MLFRKLSKTAGENLLSFLHLILDKQFHTVEIASLWLLWVKKKEKKNMSRNKTKTP